MRDVLVASSSFEDRTSLLRILDELSVNVISCSALDQAREVMSSRSIDLVFCAEHLTGGGYQDLLLRSASAPAPRLVVTVHEPDGYSDATRKGVFGEIHFPLQPTDVELVVLRAMREEPQAVSWQRPSN